MGQVLLSAKAVDEASTPEKVIRLQGSASHGGFTISPNVIRARMVRELKGACTNVFLFVWGRTAGFRRFSRRIPMSQFVENISYSERTIGDAILWLEENRWIFVERGGNRPNIYGVSWELLQDAGCLEDLPTDGGESDENLPADHGKSASAKVADQTYNDLKSISLKENTPSTPINRSGPEADENENEPAAEGCAGCAVSQPEIPESESRGQESEDAYRVYFDSHHEVGEPKPRERHRSSFDSQPEIGDDALSQELKYCGLYRRNIVKVRREHSTDYLWAVLRTFKRDMGEKHNVKSFPAVLAWRIKNGVVSWERDAWLADVQDKFDESVKSDRSRLLGIVEYAGLEQNMRVEEVFAKLDCPGIRYLDLRKWAQLDQADVEVS